MFYMIIVTTYSLHRDGLNLILWYSGNISYGKVNSCQFSKFQFVFSFVNTVSTRNRLLCFGSLLWAQFGKSFRFHSVRYHPGLVSCPFRFHLLYL